MKVLYFILGLSDFRSGGMTMYADALIKNISEKDDVTILFPGKSSLMFSKLSKIRKYKTQQSNKIQFYELINPTLIPLLYGVKKPGEIIYNCRKILSNEELYRFYSEVKPDIFHIHTVMGLPIELVRFLHEKEVKLVYTTHDYYGICPKVNLINYKDEYCTNRNEKECTICNKKAKSAVFLKLRNNPTLIKNKKVILSVLSKLIIKGTSRREFHNVEKTIELNNENENVEIEKYELFYSYYYNIFRLIDFFHFNSYVTEGVYKQYFDITNSKMIPITHNKIRDNRSLREYDQSEMKIGFIGSLSSYKGFSYLYEVLNELKLKGYTNWKLVVWGTDKVSNRFEDTVFMGKYNPDHMEMVFNSMDVLIVPSVCKETFSFVALEALSYGVPVIVSENVGAKSIVLGYGNYVYQTKEDLRHLLIQMLTELPFLHQYNTKILEKPFDHSMKHHTDIIKKELYSTLTIRENLNDNYTLHIY